MATIAYILLCHKDPEAIIDQAERLTAVGDYMSIHFDASASASAYAKITDALADNPNVTFARKRVKCGWGEWSLVQATIHAIQAGLDAFPRATHFYMLSGDCMPIKSASFAHAVLDENEVDYIESFDFFDSDWIKTGIKEERLIYRHIFNERGTKALFYASLNLQRRLGMQRKIPSDLQIQIGSQWWCLRRQTIEKVMQLIDRRRDIVRFFKYTWIPDETFFQTLVRHLVPGAEIQSRTMTFLLFSDYGMPVNFYNDHYDLLISQDYLFARKISPDANALKRRLGQLYANENATFQVSNEGRSLFRFLTGRGRIGRRFSTRFWEMESTLGRERELMIIVCKKWHVAKRLAALIRERTSIPTLNYLFHEEDTAMPDLGGIQNTMAKRTRHRRALMRMLFDYYSADRMLICLDPGSLDLLNDFCSDRSVTKLLDVECDFSDEYLIGHARRVGLAGDQTPPEALERLLPTVRNAINLESDQLHDAEFDNLFRFRQNAPTEANAHAIARFLAVSDELAHELAKIPHLFSD